MAIIRQRSSPLISSIAAFAFERPAPRFPAFFLAGAGFSSESGFLLLAISGSSENLPALRNGAADVADLVSFACSYTSLPHLCPPRIDGKLKAAYGFPYEDDARDSGRTGSEAWFATWPIIYEFLRVATHPNVFERPRSFEEAWAFVEGLLLSSSFGILTETRRHPEVVRELIAEYPSLSGSIIHDLHTAALMREHGVTEIRTNDTHFNRFTFLRVVNPLID